MCREGHADVVDGWVDAPASGCWTVHGRCGWVGELVSDGVRIIETPHSHSL